MSPKLLRSSSDCIPSCFQSFYNVAYSHSQMTMNFLNAPDHLPISWNNDNSVIFFGQDQLTWWGCIVEGSAFRPPEAYYTLPIWDTVHSSDIDVPHIIPLDKSGNSFQRQAPTAMSLFNKSPGWNVGSVSAGVIVHAVVRVSRDTHPSCRSHWIEFIL